MIARKYIFNGFTSVCYSGAGLPYMTEIVPITHDMMCSVVADDYKWCIMVMLAFECLGSNELISSSIIQDIQKDKKSMF